MRLLVKYPTKWRWSRFKDNLVQYVMLCRDWDRTRFLITVDEDDPWPQDLPLHYGSRIATYTLGLTVTPPLGKVAAINHGIPNEGWDALVVVADDMTPTPGWDQTIREDFESNPQAWAINYNDDPRLGENWRDLITLPVLRREYYTHFGWVYNPIYKSECCDCEQTIVLKKMGKIAHVDKTPIMHEWHKYQNDHLAHINMRDGDVDRITYRRRMAEQFS